MHNATYQRTISMHNVTYQRTISMHNAMACHLPKDDVILGAVPEIDEEVDDAGSEKLAEKAVMGSAQRNVQMALDERVKPRVEVTEHVRVQVNAC